MSNIKYVFICKGFPDLHPISHQSLAIKPKTVRVQYTISDFIPMDKCANNSICMSIFRW